MVQVCEDGLNMSKTKKRNKQAMYVYYVFCCLIPKGKLLQPKNRPNKNLTAL